MARSRVGLGAGREALQPGYRCADEFESGLTLILDALRPDEIQGGAPR